MPRSPGLVNGAQPSTSTVRASGGGAFYDKFAHKSLQEIAGLFDTVYVSFYKGLGGIAGCCVAGDAELIDELTVWRTRHGGRCFMLWPYAASALTVLRSRLPLMAKYYRHAGRISRALHGVPGIEVLPEPVQSPMMHLRLAVGHDEMRARVVDLAKSEKIWTFARPFFSEGPRLQRVELQVGSATLQFTPSEVRRLLEWIVGTPGSNGKTAKRASVASGGDETG